MREIWKSTLASTSFHDYTLCNNTHLDALKHFALIIKIGTVHRSSPEDNWQFTSNFKPFTILITLTSLHHSSGGLVGGEDGEVADVYVRW